jgi:formate/nitrite transporter FocA (FNT family)
MASSKRKQNEPVELKPQKSQVQILQHTEEAALTQLNRSPAGLMLSAFSAGLDIGFSVLLMAVILTLFNGVFPDPVVEFLVANMYPIGFIFVVLGRSELFTEHTTLAVLPVLQGLASLRKLLRLWLFVYVGNIAGGLIFALILSYLANSIHFLEGWSIAKISESLITHLWITKMLTAALAGWLMGLLAWLVAAARETVSQIFIIWTITTCIGVAHLSHCIVGNIEVSAGLMNGNISFAQYLNFLLPVTIGNIIGGVFFVGILKYSHTALSGKEEEVDLEEISSNQDSTEVANK